jgi:hypothetical protein
LIKKNVSTTDALMLEMHLHPLFKGLISYESENKIPIENQDA